MGSCSAGVRTSWRFWRVAGFLLALGAGAWIWRASINAPSLAGEQAAGAKAEVENAKEPPHVVSADGKRIEAGRYLVMVAGCNDCHTPGWDRAPGKVPEAQWLSGVPLGWRGPWGTSYAANLRLTVQKLNADEWVKMMHTRNGRPPMPWASVNAMSDSDVRAIYEYIHSLGPAGEAMPADLPPGVEPTGPYLNMEPVFPKKSED